MSINLDFGNSKISTFKEWMGKERRLLQHLIEDDLFNSENISKVLVNDCEETPKKYYSEDEINFIMMNLYNGSINSNFDVQYTCSGCEAKNVKNVDVGEVLNNKQLISLDFFESDNFKVIFCTPDYDTYSSIFDLLEKKSDKYFLNFLIHIDRIFIDGNEVVIADKLKDTENVFEALPMGLFDKLLQYYDEHSFIFEPNIIDKCPKCGTENTVYCSYLPNLL